MSDFFGKLKSGAEKVAFEADKMNRLNRAKSELEKTQSQLNAEFEKLGKIYYSQRGTGEISGPEFDQICQGITDLVKQVEAKDGEVKKIDAETYGQPAASPATPSVFGQTQSGPATASAQPSPPTQAAPPPTGKTTKFCPSCGTELPLDTKFCTNCGSKV